jgi:hypothetical protein
VLCLDSWREHHGWARVTEQKKIDLMNQYILKSEAASQPMMQKSTTWNSNTADTLADVSIHIDLMRVHSSSHASGKMLKDDEGRRHLQHKL